MLHNPRTDGFVDPCVPIRALKAPEGGGWVHEIKHDGYRLIVRRDGDTVRLFTRRMDVRLAAGNVDRMRMFAKELVGLQPDVIIVGGTPNIQRNMGNSGS